MTAKNIDKTIQKLLYGYAQWCYTILQKEHKRLQKQYFPTKEDQAKAVQEYTRAKQAYEFLLKIAKEPDKYLYSGKDLIYADDDLYNKLDPILVMPYDKNQNNLLVNLSKAIAHHVNYESHYNENGNWIYYGNSATRDLEAEKILKMNKAVQLWNANALIAPVIDLFFVPSMFAVDKHKKEK